MDSPTPEQLDLLLLSFSALEVLSLPELDTAPREMRALLYACVAWEEYPASSVAWAPLYGPVSEVLCEQRLTYLCARARDAVVIGLRSVDTCPSSVPARLHQLDLSTHVARLHAYKVTDGVYWALNREESSGALDVFRRGLRDVTQYHRGEYPRFAFGLYTLAALCEHSSTPTTHLLKAWEEIC